MSQEKFSNSVSTTFYDAVDNTQATVYVISTAGFPATGLFRIKSGSELMRVVFVGSAGGGPGGSTSLQVERGVEGTTAAAHAAGALVVHILTAASLRRATQEIGDSLSIDGQYAAGVGYGHSVAGNYALAVGSDNTTTGQSSFVLGESGHCEHPSGFTQAIPANLGAGGAQRTTLLGYLEVAGGSSGLILFNGADFVAMSNPNHTWLVRGRCLVVDNIQSVNVFEFKFAFQTSTTNLDGEFVGNINPEMMGGYAPGASLPTAYAEIMGAGLKIDKNVSAATSGGNLSFTADAVSATGGTTYRYIVELEILQLVMPVSGGGGYYY